MVNSSHSSVISGWLFENSGKNKTPLLMER
jgi:hypothetical protein